MPLRLPPLSSLRFFEAAGRHLSFKLAAAELNVTPSAVSHGIVALEQALGVELFVREPRKLSLTPEGRGLSALRVGGVVADRHRHAAAAEPAGEPHDRGELRADARLALAAAAPARVQQEAAGHVSVTVDTSRRQVGFPVDGFDFAIRMSRAPVAGAAWTRLFGERLVPVCSPAYRDGLVDEAGSIDLRRATLIHVTPASEDWQAWLDRMGIDGIEASGGLRFDTIQLAFEAAMMGLGVVLGRLPLVDRDLASGALVELRPEAIVAETAYWLVSSEGADHRPDLARLQALAAQGGRGRSGLPASRRADNATGENPSPVVKVFSFAASTAPRHPWREECETMAAANRLFRKALGSEATLVVLAAALVLSAAMGIRQTFGLFIGPFSFDRGLPVTLIAFAIALHNLVWGFAQPFAGAAADRYGSAPVVAFGAITFAAGLTLAAVTPSGALLVVGMGLLVGIGISCTTFGVVLTGGRPHRLVRRSAAWRWVSRAPAARSARS